MAAFLNLIMYNEKTPLLVRSLNSCRTIIAGDETRLTELLHPDRDYSFSGRYSLAHAVLPAGRISLKYRLKNGEVYYIFEGRGKMHVDRDVVEVGAGDAVDIPSGSVQWLENIGENDLIFLCIVDPAWKIEDEEVLD